MRRAIILGMLVVILPATVLAQVQKAPDLTLKDLRGRNLRLSSYKGKVMLLNFWATWCPPCRAEMPDLVRWQREHRGRGLQVIGVTYPPTQRSAVRNFIRSLKVNYPVVLGTKGTKALFDEGKTLPITVVIDREGNIRETIEGILLPEEFEEKIKPLLEQIPMALSRIAVADCAGRKSMNRQARTPFVQSPLINRQELRLEQPFPNQGECKWLMVQNE